MQALDKSQLGEVVRQKEQKLDTPGIFAKDLHIKFCFIPVTSGSFPYCCLQLIKPSVFVVDL